MRVLLVAPLTWPSLTRSLVVPPLIFFHCHEVAGSPRAAETVKLVLEPHGLCWGVGATESLAGGETPMTDTVEYTTALVKALTTRLEQSPAPAAVRLRVGKGSAVA